MPYKETDIDKTARILRQQTLGDVEDYYNWYLSQRGQEAIWYAFNNDEDFGLAVMEQNDKYGNWFEVLEISARIFYELGWHVDELFNHPTLNNHENWDRYAGLMHFVNTFKRHKEYPMWDYQNKCWFATT